MPDLVVNRYNQKTPTTIQDNGCAISTPFYINPTQDQTKQLLNAFRNVKQRQLDELGFETNTTTPGGLVIETAKNPPLTPVEEALGMNEESLRYALFTRQGIPERLLLKLQRLTGVYVVTREQIEETFKLWLNSLYEDGTAGNPQASSTTIAKKTRKKVPAKATA